MVALPSISPRPQHPQPAQPIELPQRPPRDSTANPSLAPAIGPSQATAHPASPSSEPHPSAPPESQQPDDDEAVAEDSATYSPLLKDHVFALYCAGQRSPAIAAQLGIPERTARHWVRATLQQLAHDDVTASPDLARQQRALAIESQRAASASAWDTYHRLTAAHNQLLDRALMSTIQQPHSGEDAPQPEAAASTEEPQRLFTAAARLASAAARYLALVISANREIAHLQSHATAQDARERHATAARDAADARQLEADLIRAFTTPILPPEPALPRLSPYASSWPGGITTTQPKLPAIPFTPPHSEIAAKTATPHPTATPATPATPAPRTAPPISASAAKTAIPLAAAQAVPQPKIAAKTATPLAPVDAAPHSETAAKTAKPHTPPVTLPAAQPHHTTDTRQSVPPTSRATPKPPHPRRPASANRKPQLILPPKPSPAAHPAT